LRPAYWFLILGRDFFLSGRSPGQIRTAYAAAAPPRIDATGITRLADQVEAVIREIIPSQELETLLDHLGLPSISGIRLCPYSTAGTIGTLGWRSEFPDRPQNPSIVHTEIIVEPAADGLPKPLSRCGILFLSRGTGIVTQS